MFCLYFYFRANCSKFDYEGTEVTFPPWRKKLTGMVIVVDSSSGSRVEVLSCWSFLSVSAKLGPSPSGDLGPKNHPGPSLL